MLRTAFMGTPAFALPALEATAAQTDLRLVVTQPDKPAGRRRQLRPPPVKVRALELGVAVEQPTASVTKALGSTLSSLELDLIVVAAFGKFLGRRVLSTPRLGCINVHASLLPRHRGASPPVWAILAGDTETGVSVQQMVPEMDAGDLLATRATPIDPDETAGALTERLSALGGELLVELLPRLATGDVTATPQDHARATYAPPLRKSDGEIDWSKPARAVHDHVRAMNPWPVAVTTCPKGRLRVHRTRVVDEDALEGEPGTVVRHDPGALQVACGRGVVAIVEGQREGKKVMCAKDLVCGRMLGEASRLGV